MESERLIYDTRRLSAWLSVPVFVVGLVCLFLAADVLSSHLLGFKLLPSSRDSGSPAIGFLAALALGLFLSSVPFLRNRILYDPSHNDVLVRHSGLFGRSARRIHLESATAVEIQAGRVLASHHWSICILSGKTKREWLLQLGNEVEADRIGQDLSEATRLPLING